MNEALGQPFVLRSTDVSDGSRTLLATRQAVDGFGIGSTSGQPEESQRRSKKRFGGAPVVISPPSASTIRAARFAVFFTGIAWICYLVEQLSRFGRVEHSLANVVGTIVFIVMVTLLTVSSIAYLLSRLGCFERLRAHRRTPRSAIDDFFEESVPSLTVLVPSYRENINIIRQTLLSAALQEYPNLRITLLVDDPPNPVDVEAMRGLEKARALPGQIAEMLKRPRRQFEDALETFERDHTDELIADNRTLATVAAHYDDAADWFDSTKALLPRGDHADEFLIIEVIERLGNDLRATAVAIRDAMGEKENPIGRKRVHQLYVKLTRIFQADLNSFERKQFASLSHEPNKAMNLNSYIGLMGGSYSVMHSPGGRVLVPAGSRTPDLTIPDSDYLLTLDADSMLLPEYCLRLVYLMEQEENHDIAVAQTPYSAFRGSSSYLERIAGATTDLQFLAHQGLTHHQATSWVGANAVIRKRALEELEMVEDQDGFEIKRYIRDRTVIEDTDSSIDMRAKGWQLYNYPERLSYSATPPDFGSLAIQRRRWSNGGLIILPNLLRQIRRREPGVPRPSFGEFFFRGAYLASISWASVALLIMLFYPFDDRLLSRFAVITALPYFVMMASDLNRTGYKFPEIFVVYGFNLLLLPVNLIGTIESMIQGIGGQKLAFARTPKIKDHTVAPLLFLVVPFILIGWSGYALRNDLIHHTYFHGAFAATNLAAVTFAVIFLVGPRTILLDALVNLRDFVYRPVTLKSDVETVPHWASVLYVGSSVPEVIDQNAPLAVALAAHDRLELDSERTQREVVPSMYGKTAINEA